MDFRRVCRCLFTRRSANNESKSNFPPFMGRIKSFGFRSFSWSFFFVSPTNQHRWHTLAGSHKVQRKIDQWKRRQRRRKSGLSLNLFPSANFLHAFGWSSRMKISVFCQAHLLKCHCALLHFFGCSFYRGIYNFIYIMYERKQFNEFSDWTGRIFFNKYYGW